MRNFLQTTASKLRQFFEHPPLDVIAGSTLGLALGRVAVLGTLAGFCVLGGSWIVGLILGIWAAADAWVHLHVTKYLSALMLAERSLDRTDGLKATRPAVA